ncbi:MAG: DNA polymerase sliding clamp [archaeon]|nr:DNA polymerase sliding clamp [archaeon]
MFKAEVKADTLKGLVNVISTLIDEVKFSISPKEITLKAVDPAHIAMIELNIDASAFESYTASQTEIGLDLDKVKDVLKLSSPCDIISIEQDESCGRLIFKVGNITRRMNVIDTSSMSDPKVPQLNLSSAVEVSAIELQRGIRASENISDHISLTVSSDYFELACDGDTDSISLKLDKSQLISLTAGEGAANQRYRSMFPLDYFSNLIKTVPSNISVKIELDNDYPLMLNFALSDGKSSVKYLLAPRIESD